MRLRRCVVAVGFGVLGTVAALVITSVPVAAEASPSCHGRVGGYISGGTEFVKYRFECASLRVQRFRFRVRGATMNGPPLFAYPSFDCRASERRFRHAFLCHGRSGTTAHRMGIRRGREVSGLVDLGASSCQQLAMQGWAQGPRGTRPSAPVLRVRFKLKSFRC
jgi:hypothetical protein